MAELSKTRLFSRFLAHHGVRNTMLEDLHAGTSPSSKTGDYSDVKVVTPYGEIPWNNLSRFSDKEMRELMLDVENHIFSCFYNLQQKKKLKFEIDAEFMKAIKEAFFGKMGVSWDIPEK